MDNLELPSGSKIQQSHNLASGCIYVLVCISNLPFQKSKLASHVLISNRDLKAPNKSVLAFKIRASKKKEKRKQVRIVLKDQKFGNPAPRGNFFLATTLSS